MVNHRRAPSGRPLRLQFVLAGEPNDAFFSQGAMFRRAMDALGGIYRDARLTYAMGSLEPGPVPPRWEGEYRAIEIVYADEGEVRRLGIVAQCELTWKIVDPEADVVFLCDADTLLLSPFPLELLRRIAASDAVFGVMAHYPPHLDGARVAAADLPDDADAIWDFLAERVLGRPMLHDHRYSLRRPLLQSPFYINGGAIIGRPRTLGRLWSAIESVLPRLRRVLDNYWSGQISTALAVAESGMPAVTLPLRYNYPNDRTADRLYPDELANVVLMHYLRTDRFDRHRVFHDPVAFDAFMAAPLAGSDAVFRARVRSLTGGTFPFEARTSETEAPRITA
jgi:hypothetical protein